MPQRPTSFRINRASHFASDLVFASLGNNPGSSSCLDSTLYRNNGNLFGTNIHWIPNNNRYGIDFSPADDDRVLMPFTQSLAVTGDRFTAAFWLDSRVATTAGNAYAFSKYDTVGVSREWAVRFNASTGALAIVVSANGSSSANTVSTVQLTTGLHHYAVVYTGPVLTNSTWDIYRDGILEDSIAINNQIPGNNQSHLTFGGLDVGASVDGIMTDAMFWQAPLTGDQIQQLADPSNVFLSGLIQPEEAVLTHTEPPPPSSLLAAQQVMSII